MDPKNTIKEHDHLFQFKDSKIAAFYALSRLPAGQKQTLSDRIDHEG
jgi:anti-sigma-K factor RskA